MADNKTKKELLPANMWGERWKVKLAEMYELYCRDDKSNDTSISQTSNEKQNKTGRDASLQHKLKQKKKKVKEPLPSTNGKYMQRLKGFARNQLASRLRAPRVWEEAVGVWTNGHNKLRFCVVMVSLLLNTFAFNEMYTLQLGAICPGEIRNLLDMLLDRLTANSKVEVSIVVIEHDLEFYDLFKDARK